MQEEVEGIVTSSYDYGESSRILNVITREHGLIGIISKGCKKLKSINRSVSERLTYGKFNIYYKNGSLSTLQSVDLYDEFKNIKTDIVRLSYSTYLLELAEQIIKQTSNTSVLDLLISALRKINEKFDPKVITCTLELKYLYFLGVAPVVDECAICGGEDNIVTFSSTRGGLICGKCFENEKKVSLKSVKLLRALYYVDINKITKIDVSKAEIEEISSFLDEYYDEYTGLFIKSKKFLKNLDKIS